MMNQRNRRACLHPVTAVVLFGALLLPGAVVAQSTTGTVAAQQELRIQELESQISALTGQVEQLSYQVRQLTDKLDRMASDFDFRLTQLEGGGQGDGAGLVAGAVARARARTIPPRLRQQQRLPPRRLTGRARHRERWRRCFDHRQRSEGFGNADPDGIRRSGGHPAEFRRRRSAGHGCHECPERLGPNWRAVGSPSDRLPGATADEQYQYAFGLLRENRYDDAEKALRTFIIENPEHQLTGNANYWLGETYYVRGDYKNAAITFAQGVKNYPQSGKATRQHDEAGHGAGGDGSGQRCLHRLC